VLVILLVVRREVLDRELFGEVENRLERLRAV
jgi:hypothetical protein